MAYGFYRVHVGSLACGYVAEQYADGCADGEGDVDGPCGYRRGHAHERYEEIADQSSEDDAKYSSREGDEY